MNKLMMLSLLLLSNFLMEQPKAQVRFNVNIGVQPNWGPRGSAYAEYYYLPEYEVYYHVPAARFIFWGGNDWIFASNLPYRFRRIDLFSTFKVVINEPRPYLYHNQIAARYNYPNRWSGRRPYPIAFERRYGNNDRYELERDNRREDGYYGRNERNNDARGLERGSNRGNERGRGGFIFRGHRY
jgi:hypothetical protein